MGDLVRTSSRAAIAYFNTRTCYAQEFPPFPSLLHVYVEDVDAVYERALAAGAEVVEAPKTREGDPDKRGSVKDPCGNTWAIATQRP